MRVTFPIAFYKLQCSPPMRLHILIPTKMGTMFGGAIGLCFLSLFLLLFSPVAFSEEEVQCPRCHPQDKKVLLRIKKDLNNPYLLASWDPKDKDCSGWCCIKCDYEPGRISSLEVSSSVPDTNLSAHIPPSVGDLPYLRDLTFHKLPKLTGPIPPTIPKLTKLKSLRIDRTSISGPLPPFLDQLENLRLLILSHNNLLGPIPPTLSKLPNLGSLQLDHNKIMGPIPDSFGSFKQSPDLILSHNQLFGPIPPSLGNLDPERIDLSRNKLEGDASVLFGSNKRTQILDVSKNKLSFNFSKVEFPKKSLIWLDLNHNQIYGKIPVGLAAVETLQHFNVSYNRLQGEIPQGGELQKKFTVYEYVPNKGLCGKPLPRCK